MLKKQLEIVRILNLSIGGLVNPKPSNNDIQERNDSEFATQHKTRVFEFSCNIFGYFRYLLIGELVYNSGYPMFWHINHLRIGSISVPVQMILNNLINLSI